MPQPPPYYQQSILGGAQGLAIDASGPPDNSIAPVDDDPMPHQPHTGPQSLGTLPDHSNDFHDKNVTRHLDTGEGNEKMTPAMGSPPGQLGFQRRGEKERAMTPDEDCKVL